MTTPTLAAMAVALMLAGNAVAQGTKPQPSYTFADVHYVRSTSEDGGFEVDDDAIAITGSYVFGSHFHAAAGYENTTFEGFGFDVDMTTIHVGAGAQADIFDGGSVYVTAGYARVEFGTSGRVLGQSFSVSEDFDGYLLKAGVRAKVHERFEVSAGVSSIEIEGDSEQTFSLDGEYRLVDNIGIRVRVERDEDGTGFGLGARLYF